MRRSPRTFLRRDVLALFAGAGFGAARAVAQEAEADPHLLVETVTFSLRRQIFKNQLIRLRTGGKRPGVLLIPDQRGVDAFYRRLARRLALDGMIVMLPDLASAAGLPADASSEDVQNALARLPPADAQQALASAADMLARHAECTGSIASVGFSGGATWSLLFAVAGDKVKAAVAYYPVPPSIDRVAELRVPVLFHWSEDDPRTAPIVDGLEKRLIGSAKPFEAWVYPDTQSGFASEPNSRRWDAKSADRAYERTLFFLRRHLAQTP